MGLYVQTLSNIPDVELQKDYYIYLLDYGWKEPLGEALMSNYEKMASLAAKNKAVVIRGVDRVHFEDEVLSWHNVNGEEGEKLLPAILITNRHPKKFKAKTENGIIEPHLKMVLIPIKKFCKTSTEVINLIEDLFNDIENKKDLDKFKISKEIKRGVGKALADSIILEPNIGGFGFSFKNLIKYLR